MTEWPVLNGSRFAADRRGAFSARLAGDFPELAKAQAISTSA
jgi:hypothetical protein